MRRFDRAPSSAAALVGSVPARTPRAPACLSPLSATAAPPHARTGSLARRIVVCATGIYALVFAATATVHYEAFQSGRGDLGTMMQAVANTAHGRFLEVTSFTGEQFTRLGAHVDPLLALFAPLWLLWPSGLLLLLTQAVAVSCGAIPVFWLARKHLASDRAAAHLALAYLLYPATQFNAFTVSSGFHAVSLAVPLVLFAIWYLDEDRLVPFAACAVLTALTKEEMAAAIGLLGLWYAVRRGRGRVGFTILALGLVVSAVDFLVIVPHFSPTGADLFAGRYTEVGGTPTGIARALFTHPARLVDAVATGHKLGYLALLFVPLLGFCLLEPLLLLGAAPDLAINLLSSHGDQTRLAYHWTAGIVPFLIGATVLGLARFKNRAGDLTLLVLVAVTCIAVYSPLLAVFARHEVSLARASNPHHAAVARALELIPPSAPVAATNQLGTYVSGRRYVYVFPYIRRATWIIVDKNNPALVTPHRFTQALKRYEASPAWRLVYSSRGIVVLHRVGA